MEALIIKFLIVVLIGLSKLEIGDGQSTLNVVKFGAVGDGKTDDSAAFLKAWQVLCGSNGGTARLEIPASKTFFLSQADFTGPCSSSSVHVKVMGNVVGPDSNEYKKGDKDCWLCFREVKGLVVHGSGKIDGNGQSWWSKPSSQRPRALYFYECDNLKLDGLTHLNSPRNHITIYRCNGVDLWNLHIFAPANSPNTDGIDISESTQVRISDCFIGTGDDCIAIKGGSSNINITKVTCGPGHGISIGSLGEGGSNEEVEQVYVRDCTFNGTQKGARIKTMPGGSGFVRTISFEEITLIKAGTPIDIDQRYCNGNAHRCPDKGKAVAIGGLTYRGFHGSSSDEPAIYLDCSNQGCSGITIDDVNITSSNERKVQAICKNAHGKAISTTPAVSCLLP